MNERVKHSIQLEEYSQRYTHSFCCWNCGKYQQVYVLKKTLLDECDTECEKCGGINNLRKGKP